MGKQAIGKTKGGFNTKIHMICTDENNPVIFSLSPGNAGNAPSLKGSEIIVAHVNSEDYDDYDERNEAEQNAACCN